MFVIATVVDALALLLHWILSAYTWVIIISALLSWVNPDPYNPIVRTLRTITEPLFYRVRRALPFVYTSGIDFSPIVVLLAVQFADIVLVRLSARLAYYIATMG